MALSFTPAPVPEVSRKVQDNPFIAQVESLLPANADLTGKDWKATGSLVFSVDTAETEQRGTKHVSILGRYMRQMTEAGDKLGVTVRRQATPDTTDEDGNLTGDSKGMVTIKMWPVPKITRNGSATAENASDVEDDEIGDDE